MSTRGLFFCKAFYYFTNRMIVEDSLLLLPNCIYPLDLCAESHKQSYTPGYIYICIKTGALAEKGK